MIHRKLAADRPADPLPLQVVDNSTVNPPRREPKKKNCIELAAFDTNRLAGCLVFVSFVPRL